MNQDSKVFLDTNILVHLTLEDFDPEKNIQAQNLVHNLLENEFEVFHSTQVLREFYAVVTSNKFLTNSLSPREASEQIDSFISAFSILPDTLSEMQRCKELCNKYNITSQKIHDTNIAASMLTNGIKQIITFNKKDFQQFSEIICLLPLDF